MKKARIAVMSDIHGNLAALDAVLADLERRTSLRKSPRWLPEIRRWRLIAFVTNDES